MLSRIRKSPAGYALEGCVVPWLSMILYFHFCERDFALKINVSETLFNKGNSLWTPLPLCSFFLFETSIFLHGPLRILFQSCLRSLVTYVVFYVMLTDKCRLTLCQGIVISYKHCINGNSLLHMCMSNNNTR